MCRTPFYRLLLLLLIIALDLFPLFSSAPDEDVRILFISSYSPSFSTFSQQLDGLREAFKNHKILLEIEYMDMKRFPSNENKQNFHRSLVYKLNNTDPFKIVIVADDYAFDYAIEQKETLFANSRIIFLGVNNISKALSFNSDPQISGVIESVSMEETIKLALDLFPEADKIVAISDATVSGMADASTFISLETEFPPTTLSLVSLNNLSWTEMKSHLKSLNPAATCILLLSAYTDKDQLTFNFDESLALISESTDSPIFHLWEHGIGSGVLGGKVISHYEQGFSAGQLAVRIIDGAVPESLDIIVNSPNKYMFDYNELKIKNVSLNSLPGNHIVINSPDSFFFKYRIWILNSLVLFFLFMVIFIIVVNSYRKLKKANDETKKFKAIIDQTPLSIIITDANGNIEFVNDSCSKLTGYGSSELIGKNPRIFQCSNSSTDYTELWNTLLKGETWQGKFTNKNKDGSIYIEEALIFSYSDNKESIKGFCGIKKDITELLKAKDENRLFRFVFDYTGNSVEILDSEGLIVYVNNEFVRRTGYSLSEIKGKKPLEIFADETTDNYEIEREMWETLKTGRSWQGRYTNKIKSGDLIIEEVVSSPIWDDEGNLLYYSFIKNDVTKIIEQQKRETKMRNQILEAQHLESIGKLTSGIAHDFNNYLSGIFASIQLLSKSKFYEDKHSKKLIDIIQLSAERSASLVERILGFSGSLKEKNGSFKIHDVVEDSLRILSCTLSNKISVKLDNKITRDGVKGDKTGFENAIINLCINANHAMEDRGVLNILLENITIDSKYCKKSIFNIVPGAYIKIAISDTGCGISQEILNKIFEPFYTTKSKGTGLGLYSVFSTVKSFNGEISVISEIGVGSTFTILIPLEKEVQLNSDIHPPAEPQAPFPEQLNLTALVVDDDQINREIASNFLNHIDIKVKTAANGAEGVVLFDNSIDFVLMDIQMPLMDGIEATKKIREIDPDAKIIIASGYIDDSIYKELSLLKVNGILNKPFNLDELKTVIEKVFLSE